MWKPPTCHIRWNALQTDRPTHPPTSRSQLFHWIFNYPLCSALLSSKLINEWQTRNDKYQIQMNESLRAFQMRQTLLTNSNQVENGRDWKTFPRLFRIDDFECIFVRNAEQDFSILCFSPLPSYLALGVWGAVAKKTVSLRSIERKVIRFNLVSFDWNVRFQINTIFLFFASLPLIVANEPLTRAFNAYIPRKPKNPRRAKETGSGSK